MRHRRGKQCARQTVCEQLLFGLRVGIVEEDIRQVLRLGRRDIDKASPDGAARPILVQLWSRAAKNLIMKSLCMFKFMEAKFRKVVVAHDMTK